MEELSEPVIGLALTGGLEKVMSRDKTSIGFVSKLNDRLVSGWIVSNVAESVLHLLP